MDRYNIIFMKNPKCDCSVRPTKSEAGDWVGYTQAVLHGEEQWNEGFDLAWKTLFPHIVERHRKENKMKPHEVDYLRMKVEKGEQLIEQNTMIDALVKDSECRYIRTVTIGKCTLYLSAVNAKRLWVMALEEQKRENEKAMGEL